MRAKEEALKEVNTFELQLECVLSKQNKPKSIFPIVNPVLP